MKIFIINLERSQDRKEHMLSQIAELKRMQILKSLQESKTKQNSKNDGGGGVKLPQSEHDTKDLESLQQDSIKFQNYEFIFFKAIDSKSKEFAEFKKTHFNPYTCYMFHGRVINDNEIACYASHYALWSECITLNEPIAVLEDDVNIESNFFSALNEIQNSKFAFVRGYFCDKSRDKFTHEIGHSHFYYALKNLNGTQGYYITPQAARAFCAFECEEPVDIFIEFTSKHHIDNIIYKPFFVTESLLHKSSTINRDINQNVPLIYKILRPFYRTFIATKRFIFKLFYKTPNLSSY